MIIVLRSKYENEIEVTSKPIAAYQSDEYFELDLPVAPAAMVGDEIVVEGADIREERARGGHQAPPWGSAEPVAAKKGLLDRLLRR